MSYKYPRAVVKTRKSTGHKRSVYLFSLLFHKNKLQTKENYRDQRTRQTVNYWTKLKPRLICFKLETHYVRSSESEPRYWPDTHPLYPQSIPHTLKIISEHLFRNRFCVHVLRKLTWKDSVLYLIPIFDMFSEKRDPSSNEWEIEN